MTGVGIALLIWIGASLVWAFGFACGARLAGGSSGTWEAGHRAGAWEGYSAGYRAAIDDRTAARAPAEVDTPAAALGVQEVA